MLLHLSLFYIASLCNWFDFVTLLLIFSLHFHHLPSSLCFIDTNSCKWYVECVCCTLVHMCLCVFYMRAFSTGMWMSIPLVEEQVGLSHSLLSAYVCLCRTSLSGDSLFSSMRIVNFIPTVIKSTDIFKNKEPGRRSLSFPSHAVRCALFREIRPNCILLHNNSASKCQREQQKCLYNYILSSL